jgi:SpoVK/Ycf46/Vps4 family AAA+-type ATPase
MQPAICWIDEIDKAFAGVGGSGAGDSGVSARMFGSFLSWLNDHESDVFVVCTANDVTKLPPEFARAERFDAVYFLDLPSAEEKSAIWQIYLEAYEIEAQQQRPDDSSWTGAEIKACCRLSVLLDEPIAKAAEKVVPVAVTSAESIGKLREWASGRCLDATTGSIYKPAKSTRRRAVRPVGPNPSDN